MAAEEDLMAWIVVALADITSTPNLLMSETPSSIGLNRVPLRMDFTEINSRGKRGELLERIDSQNSRFRTAKTTIIKFGLHASFVELESTKSALNELIRKSGAYLRARRSKNLPYSFSGDGSSNDFGNAGLFSPMLL
ncbi:hypothetical protein TNCV_4711021 [Trichonephila clavipes]|uniref:Uncharacterized protein n=1 Tax=Trichonephila clavipes TaxID=2585209 RepID=A0A8X6RWQ2_TRICX|nr:hypothetical protein TNCV_4711021 [Trichonephila clavipes]